MGTVYDFALLGPPEPPIGGIRAVPESDANMPNAPIAAPPGLADIIAAGAMLNGSATTVVGSVSNVRRSPKSTCGKRAAHIQDG